MTSPTFDAAKAVDLLLRQIPDWPEPGVTFRDVTPVLGDPDAFGAVIEQMAAAVADFEPDVVVGIEARGFIVGAPLAVALRRGFVPVRKAGKLPAQTYATTYDLEYGSATMEIHTDALRPGARVMLVDDVLATGGTLVAAADLIKQSAAEVVGAAVMVELAALGGRASIGMPLYALRTYA